MNLYHKMAFCVYENCKFDQLWLEEVEFLARLWPAASAFKGRCLKEFDNSNIGLTPK
jgi:hypothetical protein